jgi:hypothetical protein
MEIYLDLDDCLIKAHPLYGGRGVGRHAKIIRLDGENYSSRIRKDAARILQECRSIAPTRLFTSAVREYAEAHNKTFELGFLSEEMICREDYMCTVSLPYGGVDYVPLKTGESPKSILVDNNPAGNQHAILKREFLGIPRDNYIVIREFQGFPDPPCFETELATIFQKIRHHFSISD